MLKIQFKDQRREAIWVVERIYSLGSGPQNNLVIADPSVSPQHAKLITLDDKLYLKDNNSSHGSFVNNEKVDKKELNPGDIFRLGNVEIVVMDPRESLSQPALTDARLDAHWSLVSNGSWLSGQEYFITKNPTTIGRSNNCDIVIPGTHLSRQHAELKVQGNLLHVRDLASANGTFINDERISQGIAKPGDVLRMDSYSFRVVGPYTDHNLTQVRPTVTPKAITPIKPSSLPQKNWVTRPTSPGNRVLVESDLKSPTSIRAFTVILFAILLAGVGYLVYTLT